MSHEFKGRPGEKGLKDEQFECLKRLIRTVAHRSRTYLICTTDPGSHRYFFRLFDEPRNVVIVDILVVHGRCVGDELPKISGLKKMSVNQVCQELQDMNFISKADIPKKRLNPATGLLENMKGSTQEIFFINYPGALDTIRFVVHHMDQYVQRNLKSGQNDEETLYFCPPRTVIRKKQEEQKTGKKKDKGRFETVDEEVNIGCANSKNSERRDKRYTYLEYMNARVQEHNPDTGMDEWKHYCPWCLNNAKKQNKQTVDVDGRSNLPQLEKYVGAAVGVDELDDILLPIRKLLEELDREQIAIPVESNGVLFEDAMDKFEKEQRDRERAQKNRHSGIAEHVQQSVHVTLTDSTRLVAEDVTKEEKSLADKKQDYVVESRLRVLKSGSIARITEGLTPKPRNPKHICDCCDPRQTFREAFQLAKHVEKVDQDVRKITKRARLDGQFFISGVADAERLYQKCSLMSADASSFLTSKGASVHCGQLTRADIAAMPPEEYQRFARVSPLLLGDSTAFLPKPGEVMFEMNASGQFLSGSFADVLEMDF